MSHGCGGAASGAASRTARILPGMRAFLVLERCHLAEVDSCRTCADQASSRHASRSTAACAAEGCPAERQSHGTPPSLDNRAMNPLLGTLHPYPFERWRVLTRDIVPSPAHRPISLGLGEPRHPTPQLIKDAITGHLGGLASLPDHAGRRRPAPGDGRLGAARATASRWTRRRSCCRSTARARRCSRSRRRWSIRRGAAARARRRRSSCARIRSTRSTRARRCWPAPRRRSPTATRRATSRPTGPRVDEATWARTQLLFVCSPGNPTGAVMPLEEWRTLFELSDRHGFVIASDECYSEIYFAPEGQAPLGALDAARQLGRADFRNLLVFTSLSKRSNVPGLRSGFVAGDAALVKAFLLYRTYHGSAMSPVVQAASEAAWRDEAHVRRQPRRSTAASSPRSRRCWPARSTCACPTPASTSGPAFRRICTAATTSRSRCGLLAQYNVTVLPGSLLAREVARRQSRRRPHPPGAGGRRRRVRRSRRTHPCLHPRPST